MGFQELGKTGGKALDVAPLLGPNFPVKNQPFLVDDLALKGIHFRHHFRFGLDILISRPELVAHLKSPVCLSGSHPAAGSIIGALRGSTLFCLLQVLE